ncbi:MAG: DUF4097 domain-containing protein [Pirellulales bacterium]
MPRSKPCIAPLLLALAMLSVAPSAGCNALEFVPLVSAEKMLSEDFQTSASPKIVIETFNGSIDVSRGSNEQVQVDVKKKASGIDRAAAEAALDSVRVSMVQKDNTLTITAERMVSGPGSFGADVVIAVPAAADLTLTTSNGSVVCEQIAGPVEARSSNGKLEIVGGQGPLKLTTSNGAIEIEGTGTTVDARTSNGRIKFRGTLAEAKQRFRTSNGSIEIVVPDDAQFRFTGHTSNSRVYSDFQFQNMDSGRKRSRHLEGVVGENPEPKCEIAATTSNGSVSLKKASQDD